MGGSATETKVDTWIVRDSEGVTHIAQIARFFSRTGRLVYMQVATACRPTMTQCPVTEEDWYAHHLPPVTLGGGRNLRDVTQIKIVEYRLRETPTCIRCAATPQVF